MLPIFVQAYPTNPPCTKPQIKARSCLDLHKIGFIANGFYQISLSNGHVTVYCDFESEPGSAWTLVESFSFENRKIKQVQEHSFSENAPLNENTPNWYRYRMSYTQMNHFKQQSTHWRVTCSFPQHSKHIYTDYCRTTFKDFDVMTFRGYSVCKKMEFVNIRGHQCAHCSLLWYTIVGREMIHVDSSRSPKCDLNAAAGSVFTEDNFGWYGAYNKKFRCTAGPDSTTNWWFGGYY